MTIRIGNSILSTSTPIFSDISNRDLSNLTDQGALIEFDYAEKYYRGNPLIDLLGTSLGYTKEQLDHLFEYKTFFVKG